MFQMMKWFREWRLKKQALAWKEVNGRIAVQWQDLLYFVWENGFITGKSGLVDPQETWNYLAGSLGIKENSDRVYEPCNMD